MGLFVQRTGGKPDGCAIFYRHAKFTLVNHKLVRYYTPKVQILDKDNVGIVLLLKANTPDQAENPFICVANTHLLFNKKRGDIKLAQLAYLFAVINELAVLSQDDHSKTHCPVILCGDLNSLPYSPLYHFLINGQLDYSARSPAIISGQLAPSEARRGPSSRQIRTPLLPWEFGVTSDCQWRKEQESKSEGSCAHIQDRDIQESERDIERRRKPEDRSNPSDRCKSMSSIQADPYRNETLKHVDSNISDFRLTTNTNRYVETNEMKGLKIHRDSKEQPNRGQDEWNKGLGEREVRTQHISQKDGFNRDRKSDRNTEPNRHSECSRVPGSNRYTEQPQRRRDHMGSCSQGSSSTVNLTRESPSPRNRGSSTVNLTRESPSPRNRGSSTVDLTPESPSPRNRGSSTVNLTRESPSPRNRGSSTVNLTRESPSPRDRGSSTVNLTRESPSPRNRGSSTVDLTRESPSPRDRGSSTVDLTRESPSPRNRGSSTVNLTRESPSPRNRGSSTVDLTPESPSHRNRGSSTVDLTPESPSPRNRGSSTVNLTRESPSPRNRGSSTVNLTRESPSPRDRGSSTVDLTPESPSHRNRGSSTVNLTRESPSHRNRGSSTVNLTRESPSPRNRGSSTVDLTPESPSPRDRGSSTVDLTRESPSPRDRGSSTVNLTRESPSPRDRGSSTVNLTRESPSPRNRGSGTVDLTRESPSPRDRGSGTVDLTPESPSPRDRGSSTVNLTRESPSPRNRGSGTVDLTPESPSPRDRGSSTVDLTPESPSPRDRGSGTVDLTRESPSPRDRGSSTVDLTPESPSPRDRGSSTVDLTRESPSPRNRGSSTVDLTRESPSPRNRGSSTVDLTPESPSPRDRGSSTVDLTPESPSHRNRGSSTVDLTRESPSPRNRVAEPSRDSKSNRLGESKLFKDAKLNPDWTVGKSERNSEFIDLIRDTESPRPHNSSAAEENRVGISNRDPDLNRSTESSGHTSRAGEQHSHTSIPAPSSEMQTEETNYNKNRTISIPWQFKSVYTHRFRDGTPEVTTCHSKACCNVDYIFYTAGIRDRRDTKHRKYVQTGQLTLLGRLELMGKTDFNTMRLLPNHIFPSDHLSLQARFKLT